ncbi:MAG: 6,7-dimethyl-8-ribityllumazine synthase [Alphaproteobacteria bacterium]|nr:MAG: 6,7-dimethyl-8-ribityllumazine synthase [Alphaproteobacteria bacterium]
MKIAIIIADFYLDIATMLEQGATKALYDAGHEVDIIRVPGALEIPPAISFASLHHHYDGYVALGCVIRGETTHYDTVCNESARALMDLGVQHLLPIGNGILTVENHAQAIVRADPAQKNKGRDAALACLALIDIAHSQAALMELPA